VRNPKKVVLSRVARLVCFCVIFIVLPVFCLASEAYSCRPAVSCVESDPKEVKCVCYAYCGVKAFFFFSFYRSLAGSSGI